MAIRPGTQPDYFSLQIAEAKRFHMPPGPLKTKALTVVSGGCEHCSPHYEIQRSGFPCWGMEFVAQGRGKLTLNGNSCDLAAGTIFTYGPGIPQEIRSDPHDTLVKYFVDFTGKRATEILDQYGTAVQTSDPSAIISIFDDLIRNGLRDTPFSARITAVLLEHLLLKIAETAIPLGSAGLPAFATYRRCRQWIDDQHLRLATLEQIAGECHIDAAYLCRLFRRFDRQSPYQYLLRLKMSHASSLLQVPGSSVKQIADEMGFSDAFHFSRVFKKSIGISPAQFIRFTQRD
jgi:AraC-like DNA-binding protein